MTLLPSPLANVREMVRYRAVVPKAQAIVRGHLARALHRSLKILFLPEWSISDNVTAHAHTWQITFIEARQPVQVWFDRNSVLMRAFFWTSLCGLQRVIMWEYTLRCVSCQVWRTQQKGSREGAPEAERARVQEVGCTGIRLLAKCVALNERADINPQVRSTRWRIVYGDRF